MFQLLNPKVDNLIILWYWVIIAANPYHIIEIPNNYITLLYYI